jgi:Holliday junction resolvase
MAKMQRSKGARGERELARLLADELGTDITRNLLQTREGGHDLEGLPFALEVKRQETLNINAWWRQAVAQAEASGLSPALAYRQSRKPWKFIVRLSDVSSSVNDTGLRCEIEMDAFCYLIREMAAEQQHSAQLWAD